MRPLIILTAIMFTISWFMPVLEGYSGWMAFRVALSSIWPYDGPSSGGWWPLHVPSALTNGWFVISLAVLILSQHRFILVILWGLVLATLVNTLWFVLDGDRSDLRVGYYLWLASFLVLTTGAWRAWKTRQIPAGGN